MANKIVKVVIKILIISLIFQMINIPVVKAGSLWDDIINSANEFKNLGKEESTDDSKDEESTSKSPIDEKKFKETSDNIYNFLFALGVVLSVIIGAILGIQLMWGTIEQQVKVKEALLPYGIGCVLIFGAFGIWKLCVTIFGQL